ncbi:hypothetical protein, partial [Lederbergia ruris]|uniref:hypothetical protein n=1 Tax=Lederbergia ruris TaxID=217495 RepID=UPI001BB37FB8
LLKVAGTRLLFSGKNHKNTKSGGEKQIVSLHLIYFRDFLDIPLAVEAKVPELSARTRLTLASFINLHQALSANGN